MLQSIRDRLTGWVAVIIILIIGIALAISFGGSQQDAAVGSYAAKVNGEEIPILDYREAVQSQMLQMQQVYQGELPEVLERQLQENVLESMVRSEAVAQHVRSLGYRAGDEVVGERIRQFDAFHVAGEFSSQAYQAVLASQGISPARFEEDQRQAIEIEQYQQSIVESAFFTPAEFRRYLLLETEKRSATYIEVAMDAFRDPESVSDEDVQAYYEANAALFETIESVDLEFIELNMADVAADLTVSDEELEAHYQANIDRYRKQEERLASHILFSVASDADEAAALSSAEAARARIVAGESFEDVARELSDDPGSGEQGGALGWNAPGVFVEAFDEVLFSIEPGTLSEPVRTEFGFHLIRAEDVRAGSTRPLAEVRTELEEELLQIVREDRFFELADELDDLALESPDGLADVATAMGLELGVAEGFTRAGGEPFGPNANVIATVFSPELLEDGENSPLVQIDEERTVVLHVTRHRIPEQKSLDDVRAEITSRLVDERAAELAIARGEAAEQQILAGESLETVAAEFELPVLKTGSVLRDAPDVPGELVAAMFSAPRPAGGPGTVQGLSTAAGTFLIFRLDAVTPGEPGAMPREQRDQRKEQLTRAQGNGEAAAIIANIRDEASVAVAADLFDTDDDFF